MECQHTIYIDNVVLKYKSGLLGKSIERRIKGEWVDFCNYKNQTPTINDRHGVCSFQEWVCYR